MKVKKTLLCTVKTKVGRIKVYRVPGKPIRNHIDVDYTVGGHHYVYPFIPVDEAWIEDTLVGMDKDAIVHHEIVELVLMANGMKYKEAHRKATIAESKFRKSRA